MHPKQITFFDLGVKVTRNVTQYPLHHVTISATKFEVAMWRYIYKKRDGPTLVGN